MRPNYAQDAPPTELSVGGKLYPIDTDFRTWLGVGPLMRELLPEVETKDDMQHNLDVLVELEKMIFGGWLEDESISDVLDAISEFYAGYPSAPIRPEKNAEEGISFEYDLNEIIIAIQDQHHVDLSWRRKEPMHWWEFLLLFRTLSGDHYILNLNELRTYKGKDKEMLRRKSHVALPKIKSAKERKIMEEINAEFFGA